MSQWHLDCSVGQVGQQSDTHFGMRIYKVIKIISYTNKLVAIVAKDSENLEVFWIYYKLYIMN